MMMTMKNEKNKNKKDPYKGTSKDGEAKIDAKMINSLMHTAKRSITMEKCSTKEAKKKSKTNERAIS